METKNYIYLSYYLNEDTPLYGGNKGIIINKLSEIKNGDSSNTKELIFNNHSGTHIDFPNHFIDNGKVSNDYDPDFWFFNNPFLWDFNILSKTTKSIHTHIITSDNNLIA